MRHISNYYVYQEQYSVHMYVRLIKPPLKADKRGGREEILRFQTSYKDAEIFVS